MLAELFLLLAFLPQSGPTAPPTPPPVGPAGRPYGSPAGAASVSMGGLANLPPMIIVSTAKHGGEVDFKMDLDHAGKIVKIEPTFGAADLVKRATRAAKFLNSPMLADRSGVSLHVYLLGTGDHVKTVPVPYPPAAADAKISGAVLLVASVSDQGKVTHTTVISGPPQLRAAAQDAVAQWVFPPVPRGGVARTQAYASIALTFSPDSPDAVITDLPE